MTTTTPRTRTILVVDDNPEARRALMEFVRNEGFNAVGASNGRDALEHLRWKNPIGVLLDMRMPVMTGWEVRKAMKADAAMQGIPVIGLTGGRWKPGDEADFLALLAKPVDYDELRAALGVLARD